MEAQAACCGAKSSWIEGLPKRQHLHRPKWYCDRLNAMNRASIIVGVFVMRCNGQKSASISINLGSSFLRSVRHDHQAQPEQRQGCRAAAGARAVYYFRPPAMPCPCSRLSSIVRWVLCRGRWARKALACRLRATCSTTYNISCKLPPRQKSRLASRIVDPQSWQHA